jgi:hypothetical protein
MIPSYAHIKIQTHNTAAKNEPQTQTQTLIVKIEIIFLYRKKPQLNIGLYHTRIQNANNWQHTRTDLEKLMN